MRHELPVHALGPSGPAMAEAIESCVHCGFCLPACPTYGLLEQEMDSPRGRIVLMKGVLEGALPLAEANPHLDACLGCLACVTACPSGVQYGELLTPFRAFAEERRLRPRSERLLRGLLLETLPYPRRFRLAIALGRLARPLGGLVGGSLGARLRAMLALLPRAVPRARPLRPQQLGTGRRRARVTLLAGCVQQVLAPEINAAAMRVLERNGVEVVVPEQQGCCGALAAHSGALGAARTAARRTLRTVDVAVDAIVSTAAGCGSGLREYPSWLGGTGDEAAAHELARKARDVSAFLHELGMITPPPLPAPVALAYHDPCHLVHGQGVRSEPRALLAQIGNLRLVEIANGDLCCGSAGTYNLEQPRLAAELGAQKAQAVLATGAEVVATGNIGCMTQLDAHLRLLGRDRRVLHTAEVLDRAYRGVPLAAGEASGGAPAAATRRPRSRRLAPCQGQQ